MTISQGSSIIIGNRVARAGVTTGTDPLFAVDLSPNVLGVSISGTLNTAGDGTFGVVFNEVVRDTWERSINISNMYRHDPGEGVTTTRLFDAVSRNNRKGTVLVRLRDGYWVGGEYTTDGPSKTSPSEGIMAGSFNFMQAAEWVTGSNSARIDVSGTGAQLSDAIPSAGANSVAYVVILEQAAGVTVATQVGTAAATEAAGTGARIFSLPLGDNGLRVGKTAAGNGAVRGFAFVGTVERVND